MKNLLLKSGVFSYNNKPLSNELDLSKWLERSLTYLNIPYINPCCLSDSSPVRYISETNTLQYFDPTTNTWLNIPSAGSGTVTSVGLQAPLGFTVTNSPINSSGNINLSFSTGYSLPTIISQNNWDIAYNNSIISAGFTGTTTKTLTLNQQDGGTITASFNDDSGFSADTFVGTVAQIRGLDLSTSQYKTFVSTDNGPGSWYYDSTETALDNLATILQTSDGARIKRLHHKNQVFLSWFGGIADWDQTTLTGTDCKNAFNSAIQYLLTNGGGELIIEAGHYYMTPGVFINTNSQIPITIKGFSDNLSYSDSDQNVKGTVIHTKTPGTHFFVGLNADGSRFYTNPNFLYKAFAINNISFIGENIVEGVPNLGINIIQTFFTRTYMENVSATKVDYLMLQEDVDSLGNQNYCDGSKYFYNKIYQSRKGGLKLNRCDNTIILGTIAEVGTTTTENIIDIKSGSGISISGFILGGNGTIPPTLANSSMISINNCTNVELERLHIERPYFESVVYTFGNSRNITLNGIYTKFNTNYVFKFSGTVKTFHINNWFSAFSDGANSGYTDIMAVNTSTDDVLITGLNLMMADNITTRDYTISGAAINTTQSNTNNLLTTERINFPKAFNELVRGQAYIKAQDSLTGGGTITYDTSANLKWTVRFLTPIADKILGSSGFISYDMPTNGTIIAGLGTTPSITVTNNGIPLTGGWNVLLGEHTTGSSGTTIVYKVALFSTMGTNTLKPNQIIIAVRNNDNGSLRLGTGQVMQPGSIVIDGEYFGKKNIQTASAINLTINPITRVLKLNESTPNGANYTITNKSAVTFNGSDLYIHNYNTGSFPWIISPAIKDETNADVGTLDNQTVYHLISDGTVWRIANRSTKTTTVPTVTLTGNVTGSGPATGITTTIAASSIQSTMLLNNAVTFGKFQQINGLSVVGNATNALANVSAITAATDGFVLRRSGTTLGFGTIGNSSISDLAYSKLTGAPVITPDTLQTVTNGAGNNFTSNTIQITGINNYTPSTPSLLLGYTSGQGIITKTDVTGNANISLDPTGKINFNVGNENNSFNSPILVLQDTTGSGGTLSTFSSPVVGFTEAGSETLTGLNAVKDYLNSIEFTGKLLFVADGTTTVVNITHSLNIDNGVVSDPFRYEPKYFTLTTTTPITNNHLNRNITFPNPNTMRIEFNNPPLVGEDVRYVYCIRKEII